MLCVWVCVAVMSIYKARSRDVRGAGGGAASWARGSGSGAGGALCASAVLSVSVGLFAHCLLWMRVQEEERKKKGELVDWVGEQRSKETRKEEKLASAPMGNIHIEEKKATRHV